MKVGGEEPLAEKVMKLTLSIKESKNTLAKIMFKYEVQISELQIRLQLDTPLEVQEQRKKYLKVALKSIFNTLVDCRKLLYDMMQIWTSL